MIKNLIVVFIITIAIIACKHNSADLKRNDTIEYYTNDSQIVLKKSIHQADFDSVYYFYDDGTLFKKGKQYKENQKFGIWNLYDRKSNLREIREWFTIYGKSRLNKAWHLNKKGDTIAWREQDSIYNQKEFVNDTTILRNTNYDYINIQKDTIKLNETFIGYLIVFSSTIRDYETKVQVKAYLPKKGYDFNYDYSNQNEIKLDTFYDLTIDKKYRQSFPENHEMLNKIVVFDRKYESIGEKTIKGFYHEYYESPVKNDSIESIVGFKTYFERKIVVIDSL